MTRNVVIIGLGGLQLYYIRKHPTSRHQLLFPSRLRQVCWDNLREPVRIQLVDGLSTDLQQNVIFLRVWIFECREARGEFLLVRISVFVIFVFVVELWERFGWYRYNLIQNNSTVTAWWQHQLIMEMIVPYTPHPARESTSKHGMCHTFRPQKCFEGFVKRLQPREACPPLRRKLVSSATGVVLWLKQKLFSLLFELLIFFLHLPKMPTFGC